MRDKIFSKVIMEELHCFSSENDFYDSVEVTKAIMLKC